MSGFTESLHQCAQRGMVPVIPDFKMVSPGDGPLFHGRNVPEAANAMEKAGAPALSVVTEEKEFGGSLKLLYAIAKTVDIPILRKDFVCSERDLEETARYGAKAILLICSCMEPDTLRQLYRLCPEYGLEPLVETHTEAELAFATSLGAPLIGINNRDIRALERDGGTVHKTKQLAARKPANAFLVSESGIQTPADVRIALESGADAVLVGTSIWKSDDPFSFYKKLCHAGEKTL